MSSSGSNRSFSGKRLTIVLMIVLLGTGGLFYWVTTAYTTYNAARRQTDRDWRELATLLEARYRTIDERIASVEQPNLDKQLVDDWRSARDSFTGTGISGLQIQSAEKIESVIERLPDSIPAKDTLGEDLKNAVAKYEVSANHQRAVGQTLGSRLLKVMLNLPDPTDIVLH